MQRAYIDESGYTGRDLLNPDQPFIVLSALFINEEEAEALCKRHFSASKAAELKHSALVKQKRSQDALIATQRECIKQHRALTYIAHKRYFCILKLLNDCIEPVFEASGLNFYENGLIYSLGSLLYLTGPPLLGAQEFNLLLSLYQKASTTKDPADVDALSRHAETLPESPISGFFAPIANNHPAFRAELLNKLTSTNPAPSLLFGLISQLEVKSGGEYAITHDRSPSMREFHAILEKLMATDESATFKISEVAQVSYPLKLRHVSEADSKESAALQLADILAGGAMAAAKAIVQNSDADAYGRKVLPLYPDDSIMHMCPSQDPSELVTFFSSSDASSMIDFIARAASH